MAITNTDLLISAMNSSQDLTINKASITSVANFWYSLWAAAGSPGAGSLTVGNTANGLVPTDATAGAPIVNAFTGANTGYLTGFDANNTVTTCIRMYDRIFHAGSYTGLALATTTLTAIPSYTARLPAANSNGQGVEIWIEFNVAISATATTVTVTYTNQAGTTGKIATLDTNISGKPSAQMMPFRLAAGDTGVQQVTAVTVGGVVTTAGSFNIVVMRPLTEHNVFAAALAEARQDPLRTGMPQLFADSCLAIMILPQSTATGTVMADVDIANG